MRETQKLRFLGQDRRDANRRRPGDVNYDPTTLYLPPDFVKSLSGGQRQWWEFKSKHMDKVLFFKMGKFYELFEMDAHVGAKELDLQYMKGYRVLVVEQTETPEQLELRRKEKSSKDKINLGIYMKDDSKEFSILVDRSVGGSSIVDGQLELMLHRRLVHDDSRGVAEALNETVCIHDECTGLTVQGKYYLRIDPLGEGAKWRRSFGQEIYSPFLLAFTEQDGDKWTNFQVPTFSGMDPSYSLPENIAMITLQELEDRKVLLRLAHLYEVGEDKDLSVTSSVELKKMFPDKKINKITEMSLSANQEREEMLKKRLVWKVEGARDEEFKVLRGGPVDPIKQVVELAPMEIRTFVIDFTSPPVSLTKGHML